MSGAKVGSLIGAIGGLVFIMSNAGVLSSPSALVLRVVAVLAFLGAVALVLRAKVIGKGVEPSRGRMRAYGITVLAEVIAIPVGIRLLVGVFDQPAATLPWVATVVGIHFIVFAPIFKEAIFAWFGVPVALLGIAGIVLASAGADQAPISLVGGVAPGFILLAAVGWSAWAGRNGAALAPRAAETVQQ